MRSKGYGSRSVCLSVSDFPHTTDYEAAYELYQQPQCYKGTKSNVAILWCAVADLGFEKGGLIYCAQSAHRLRR